jgi:outer membrane protein assembly factor BamD
LVKLKTIVQKGIFLLLSCLVLACTTTTDKPVEVLQGILSDTDEQIFVGDSMEANYDPNVIMKRAESYFEKERYPEAIVEYKHFLDLHRGHVLAPYAQYKIALTHFKRFKTVDRDPEPVEESLAAFEKLLSDYPNNRYEAEAHDKIKTCHERLAAHHLLVGKFYYKRESYLAAAGRYEKVIMSFPEIPAAADAKYQLAMTYQDLGAQQWAADWMVDFVQHHPENENYKDGMKMLVKMQEDHPDVLIALNPTTTEGQPGLTEEKPNLGILSAGYQNGNLPDLSSVDSTASNPVPTQVANYDSPSSVLPGVDHHSSAAVHTEDALCSLGSWCESIPAPHTQQIASASPSTPPTTTVCRLGEWC